MQQVKLNGNLFDVTCMSVKINGLPLVKGVFSELNWKAAQESGIQQGNAVSPYGYTPGYAKGTGSFKMLVSNFTDFCTELKELGWPDYLLADFDIEVSYIVNQYGPNPTPDIEMVNLVGCRMQSAERSNPNSNEPLRVSVDMIIHLINENGNTPFGSADMLNPL